MKRSLLNLARQLLLMLLVIWTVVSLVTLLIEIVPGTPASVILGETATTEQIENFNRTHGLDRPAFFSRFPAATDSYGMAGTTVMLIIGRAFFAAISDDRSGPDNRSAV